MTDLLAGLNPQQRQAVAATHGPVLVLAGPGSGKTRTLTHRIAHMIQQGIEPESILAVTFTNKAAKEMRHRLHALIGEAGQGVMMGTFHSLCARILRRHIHHLGYAPSFLIYDTEDQRRLVKQVISEMNLSDKTYRANAIHGAISRAKNDGLTPKTYRAESYWEEVVKRIYEQYQEKLQTNNALDFDDLLLLTARLFQEVPSVLNNYRRLWQFIHVDEFQDTNLVQYELMRQLAEQHRNIFVVGDIDQCLPPGTRIRTPDGERPIEQIRVGDTILAGAGQGSTVEAQVGRVQKRPYRGNLVEIRLRGGRVLRATPNHVCFARAANAAFNPPPPALGSPRRDRGSRSEGGTLARADVALAEAPPRMESPFSGGAARGARWATLTRAHRYVFTPASELRPHMLVPVWRAGTITEEEIIAVAEVKYSGLVYDLDIPTWHNYVAEGMVVHNSIYGWRGADYRNILKFEESFPNQTTIALEQNYRSTQKILDAASALIRRNRNRKDKGLWSELGEGDAITTFEAYDEAEEAQYIVREIQRLKARERYGNRDFAIMYRTNAQSRALEEAFVRSSLKYVLVGGTRFYERREVKDILAYLRLLHNPYDSVALERVINVPARGIGDATYQQLTEWAARLGRSAFNALALLEQPDMGERLDLPVPFAARARKALLEFHHTLQPIAERLETINLPMVIHEITQATGFREYLEDGTPEGAERWENVVELQNVAAQYENLTAKQGLVEFLENVSLVSDADTVPEEEFDAVTLMTLHTAKGLEYPVVFIPGMNDNILPHSRAVESPEEMEEERRLAYVGITRAKQRLYLVHTFRRTTFGRPEVLAPSRFLRELPKETIIPSPDRSKRPAGEQRPALSRNNPDAEWAPSPIRRRSDTPAPAAAWTTTTRRPDSPDAKAPARPAKSGGAQFKAGDKVRHAKFGEGIVVSSTPTKDDEEVVVAFRSEAAPKKLLASFARLEKL